MSLHALDELDQYAHDVEDIECCIGNGRRTKSERDAHMEAIDGKVHTIIGRDRSGSPFYVCGKVMRTSRGTAFRVISAHPVRLR